MNISGVGPDISSLMNTGSVTPANRSNGRDFNQLESGKTDFRNALAKNAVSKSETKENPKNVKPHTYKKANANKSNLKEDLNPGVSTGEAAPRSDQVQHKGRSTTVEKYDEIESTRAPIVTEEGAMVTFLNAMQKEVGVEPQKVVEAMVSLDAEAMMRPPEETMTTILENLEIPPEKMAKAEELYQKMLMETAEASMGKMLRENEQTIDFKVMGPEQVRLQKLLKTVNDLESTFFDTKKAKEPVVPLITNEQLAINAMNTSASEPSISGIQAAQPADGAMTVEDLMAQLNAQGFRAGQETVNAKPESDSMAGGEQGSEMESSRDGEELPAEFSPLLAAPGQKPEILSSANSTRPGSPTIKSADEIANTRQLVESAQLLAQKGGGTMKLMLKPEGLGYVELKVGVNAGKVDIQMTTENNEVKRLLESGLSDLKSGLVQHKLSLENVQVDTSNRAQTGLETMLGQDRDTAREFLESFREFNQNRRQAGFDFMNTSGYSSSAAKDRRLTPSDTRYANAKKSSKRLDLVA